MFHPFSERARNRGFTYHETLQDPRLVKALREQPIKDGRTARLGGYSEPARRGELLRFNHLKGRRRIVRRLVRFQDRKEITVFAKEAVVETH